MDYRITCEAIEVDNEIGVCLGSAKCKVGEKYIIGSRTPEPIGMCGRAFQAILTISFAMRFTDNLVFEKEGGYYDVICPDGHVTYRLSRYLGD